jgi:hypothetical protein
LVPGLGTRFGLSQGDWCRQIVKMRQGVVEVKFL